MGALPKRKISKQRKGKRRVDVDRKFAANVKSLTSQAERIRKNKTKDAA